MIDWRLIESAPRDGTLIDVMHPDCGTFAMRWNPAGFNVWISTSPGIWETETRDFTWSEAADAGPHYWRRRASVPFIGHGEKSVNKRSPEAENETNSNA